MDNQNKNQSLGQGGAQGADSDQSIGNQDDSSFGASEQDAGGGMNVAPTQYAGSQGRDQDRMQQPGDRQQGGEQEQARLHRGGMQQGGMHQGGMQHQGGGHQEGGMRHQGGDHQEGRLQHEGGDHQSGMHQAREQGKTGSTER